MEVEEEIVVDKKTGEILRKREKNPDLTKLDPKI